MKEHQQLEWKEAGTPRPTVQFDGTGLTLEFRFAPGYLSAMAAPKTSTSGEVTPQVTPQVRRLLEAAAVPQSRAELQEAVGLADRKHFRQSLLNPLLASGWLSQTLPGAPNSRLQKYCLTAQGRAWLAQHRRH